MKQPEDTHTLELPFSQVARGRPPKREHAMTPAERQRAYRQRIQRAAMDIDHQTITTTPTPALLKTLRDKATAR